MGCVSSASTATVPAAHRTNGAQPKQRTEAWQPGPDKGNSGISRNSHEDTLTILVTDHNKETAVDCKAPPKMPLDVSAFTMAELENAAKQQEKGPVAPLASSPSAVSATSSKVEHAYVPTIRFADLHMLGTLGKGHFGQVYLYEHQVPGGKRYAMKYIRKKANNENLKILNEIRVLKNVSNHINVTRLVKMFESKEFFFILMDLCEEGDLWNFLFKGGSRGEAFARVCVRQMLNGLRHLHRHDVLHRDLKLENVLISKTKPDAPCDMSNVVVKLADFGLSLFLSDSTDETRRKFVGTRGYAAPEVHMEHGVYGKPADIWSIGLIAFIMLAGYHPFDETARGFNEDMKRRILTCDWKFGDPAWERVSASAKDFLSRILVAEPDQRMTAQEALDHSWLKSAVVPVPSDSWEPTEYHEDLYALPMRSAMDSEASGPAPSLYGDKYEVRHTVDDVYSNMPDSARSDRSRPSRGSFDQSPGQSPGPAQLQRRGSAPDLSSDMNDAKFQGNGHRAASPPQPAPPMKRQGSADNLAMRRRPQRLTNQNRAKSLHTLQVPSRKKGF